MQLKAIYIYPIKSLKGISLQESIVQEKGLRFDRRWMLTDKTGMFLSQRKFPQLSLFHTKMEQYYMEVSYPGESAKIQIPLAEQANKSPQQVQVWKDSVLAFKAHDSINQWFSNILKTECALYRMTDESIRMADQKYAIKNTQVSFADGYPFLMISEASLSHLNEKLDEPLPMDRFRPNFVINGMEPHHEDKLAELKIGDLYFKGVKPCARCIIPTIDQQSGKKGKEPLKTLATYRKFVNKILFGENLCWDNTIPVKEAIVKVGDRITVLQKKSDKSIQNH